MAHEPGEDDRQPVADQREAVVEQIGQRSGFGGEAEPTEVDTVGGGDDRGEAQRAIGPAFDAVDDEAAAVETDRARRRHGGLEADRQHERHRDGEEGGVRAGPRRPFQRDPGDQRGERIGDLVVVDEVEAPQIGGGHVAVGRVEGHVRDDDDRHRREGQTPAAQAEHPTRHGQKEPGRGPGHAVALPPQRQRVDHQPVEPLPEQLELEAPVARDAHVLGRRPAVDADVERAVEGERHRADEETEGEAAQRLGKRLFDEAAAGDRHDQRQHHRRVGRAGQRRDGGAQGGDGDGEPPRWGAADGDEQGGVDPHHHRRGVPGNDPFPEDAPIGEGGEGEQEQTGVARDREARGDRGEEGRGGEEADEIDHEERMIRHQPDEERAEEGIAHRVPVRRCREIAAREGPGGGEVPALVEPAPPAGGMDPIVAGHGGIEPIGDHVEHRQGEQKQRGDARGVEQRGDSDPRGSGHGGGGPEWRGLGHAGSSARGRGRAAALGPEHSAKENRPGAVGRRADFSFQVQLHSEVGAAEWTRTITPLGTSTSS